MKILFDQGTPVPLRKHLHQHTIHTTYELGWSDLPNGELLDAAEQYNYRTSYHFVAPHPQADS